MKKSAFTLIELLVVIAIIAILASLAIPALSKAMERGKVTQEASNLRQLGILVITFQNDNSDSFPNATAWPLSLNPTYVSAWKGFQSPFDKRAPQESATTAPVSFGMNTNLSTKSASDVVSASNCVLMSTYATGTWPNEVFPNQANSVAALDKGSYPGTFARGLYLNVLFADSHVAPLLTTDFAASMTNPVTGGTVTDIRWNK